MDKIKVGIVDDHALFLQGLQVLLSQDKRIHVSLAANNGQDLLVKLKNKRARPAILLLDLQMPVMDGFKALRFVKKEYPEIKVVILSQYGEAEVVKHLLKEGISGFIIKSLDFELLKRTVFHVAGKGFYFDEMTISMMGRRSSLNKKTAKEFLTHEELELVRLICEQKKPGEIADELCISLRTVESRKNKILEKTAAKNIAGIVMYAFLNELVPENYFYRQFKEKDV